MTLRVCRTPSVACQERLSRPPVPSLRYYNNIMYTRRERLIIIIIIIIIVVVVTMKAMNRERASGPRWGTNETILLLLLLLLLYSFRQMVSGLFAEFPHRYMYYTKTWPTTYRVLSYARHLVQGKSRDRNTTFGCITRTECLVVILNILLNYNLSRNIFFFFRKEGMN